MKGANRENSAQLEICTETERFIPAAGYLVGRAGPENSGLIGMCQ